MARRNKYTRGITAKEQQEFIRSLRSTSLGSAVEAEVIAPAYRRVISAYFDGGWDFDQATDGFFSTDGQIFAGVRLLLEAKYDLDLRDVAGKAVIVAQCIYYMKRFEVVGHDQPNVIFGADRDQMFVIYAPPLRTYLDRSYDWSLPPSSAVKQNPELVEALMSDRLLATFTYSIDDTTFDLNEVMRAIDKLSENDGAYDRIEISPKNVRAVFDSFLISLKILESKMNNATAVTFFITSLLGGAEAPRPDPARKNTIHLSNGTSVHVDTVAYEAFFSRYENSYSEAQISELMSMYDVLLEEVQRRFSGDFWTPTIWADEAHTLMDAKLGDQWREQFVVWDASCGTKNLTRDYLDFDRLYLSTLHQHELDTSTRYNLDAAETFQYDFLNDDIDIKPGALFGADWKMPPALYRDLTDDKPLLFLMNPPYGAAANQDETSKDGISKTAIRSVMERHGRYAHATQQLYTQFLYRIQKLKRDFGLSRVVVGVFTNERFMTGGPSYKAFMDLFQQDFSYQAGFFFNAAEFSDVAPNWGISFTLWDTRTTEESRDVFDLDVVAVTENGVRPFAHRTVRNIAGNQLVSAWLKEKDPKRYNYQPDKTYPLVAGALKLHTAKSARAKMPHGAFGYLHNNADSVEHSPKYVGLYSAAFGSANGRPVTPDNFERAAVTLAVRKCSIPAPSDMWITGHDSFTRPDRQLSDQFVADCVIYSLFSRSGSYQSAMRGVEYVGTKMNVFNEFFYVTADEMKALSEKHSNRAVSVDLKNYGKKNRYATDWLLSHAPNFSHEAQEVLDLGRTMVFETFPYRVDTDIHADLHLNAWDAGFYQLDRLARVKAPHLIERYSPAISTLRERIAVEAVEYGFIGAGAEEIAE